MALARSASGPGGLSINTGSANLFGSGSSQPPAAGGLFGNATSNTTSQPAQSGGLFGATTSSQTAGTLFGTAAAAQPAAAGGGLFGSAANTQPTQAAKPSLFGSAATTTTPAAQPSGGLFGATPATNQTQAAGGGLFGASTTQQQQQQQQQQQPQQTGGLFGGGAANSAVAQQPQQTGGLFGGAVNTAAAQPQQAGGLFGGAATLQPAQTGGLFGSSTPAAQPQAAGGFFGASTANPSTTGNTGGLFGNMNRPAPAQTTGLFGQAKPAGGAFGNSTAQPATNQQVVPGVRIDLSNLRSTTRFNDLQEDLQKQITMLDEAIQKCMKDCDAVNAFMPSHEKQLAAIPQDVNFVARKSEGMQHALANDVVTIKQLRELADQDCENARLSFRAIDNQKLPTQYHQAGLWSTRGQQGTGGNGDSDTDGNADLIGFFSKTADEMDEMMKRFSSNVGEIELHLRGLQENMLEEIMRLSAASRQGGQGADDRVAELAAVLRDFEESILKVASQVGSVREGVTELQLGEFMGNGTNGMR